MLCSKPSSFGSWTTFEPSGGSPLGVAQDSPAKVPITSAVSDCRGCSPRSTRRHLIEIRCGSVLHVPRPNDSYNKMQTMPKRSYTRRTPEDRLRELEAKLAEAKAKLEADKERDSPLHREWQKTSKLLRKFIQTASDAGRSDI